jgi:hypothetical protein
VVPVIDEYVKTAQASRVSGKQAVQEAQDLIRKESQTKKK